LEFLNSQPYYASKKLSTSRHIFRYAVLARTVTKKLLVVHSYKLSQKPMEYFSDNPVHTQTDRQTDRQAGKHQDTANYKAYHHL